MEFCTSPVESVAASEDVTSVGATALQSTIEAPQPTGDIVLWEAMQGIPSTDEWTSGDIEMWLAMQATPPRPQHVKPTTPPRSKTPPVTNPTYSEVTDTYTRVTLDTLYFGRDALASWKTDTWQAIPRA